MKAGKITAKIRDAVKVRLMEDGKERMMYRNIDLPDAIKELEIMDFGFDTHLDGKIDFMLHFDKGILPEVFPAIREKGTRKPKTPEAAAPSALRIPITTAPSAPQTPTTAAAPANAPQPPKPALPAPTPAPKPQDVAPTPKPADKPEAKPEAPKAAAPEKKPEAASAKAKAEPNTIPQVAPAKPDDKPETTKTTVPEKKPEAKPTTPATPAAATGKPKAPEQNKK